jgi:hypothetical protein
MAKATKLSLGCLGLIKPEADLIRTILRTSGRLNDNWALVEHGECDAILIYNPDKNYDPFKLKQTTKLIHIKRRGEQASGYVFFKPFRADELIDTLIAIGSIANEPAPPNIQSEKPQNTYKLKKWPASGVLQHDKHYVLLATHLSRSAKTLQDLVKLSGRSENYCIQFLNLLEARDLLQTNFNRIDVSNTNTSAKEQKQNFFSMLRKRLGLS